MRAMREAASRYRLVYWDSLQDGDTPVRPVLAASWLRSWLVNLEHRAEVIEAYSWLSTGAPRARGWLDERELNAFVRPAIERALETGELVLVERAPRGQWKPAVFVVPAEPKGPAPKEEPKSTKTWVEFEVLDENGDALADEKWEAQLPDGTKKNGKTDSRGLARFDDIDPGLVQFRLVERDGDTWKSSSEPIVATDSLEFELVDEDEEGVADQGWELKLADEKRQTGKTDADGHVRIENLKPGEVELTFPDLDGGSWKKL